MKQIKCSTGKQEFLLVEVPNDAFDLCIIPRIEPNMHELFCYSYNQNQGPKLINLLLDRTALFIGLYTPSRGEINFDVKWEWILDDDLPNDHYIAPKYPFLSFLKSVTEKETVEKWAVILINN